MSAGDDRRLRSPATTTGIAAKAHAGALDRRHGPDRRTTAKFGIAVGRANVGRAAAEHIAARHAAAGHVVTGLVLRRAAPSATLRAVPARRGLLSYGLRPHAPLAAPRATGHAAAARRTIAYRTAARRIAAHSAVAPFERVSVPRPVGRKCHCSMPPLAYA